MIIKSATLELARKINRDERLLKERRALMACKFFGLDPAQLKPVSITSRATCEEDVVTL